MARAPTLAAPRNGTSSPSPCCWSGRGGRTAACSPRAAVPAALDKHVLNAQAVILHAEQLEANMDSQGAVGMAADALRMAQHRSAAACTRCAATAGGR